MVPLNLDDDRRRLLRRQLSQVAAGADRLRLPVPRPGQRGPAAAAAGELGLRTRPQPAPRRARRVRLDAAASRSLEFEGTRDPVPLAGGAGGDRLSGGPRLGSDPRPHRRAGGHARGAGSTGWRGCAWRRRPTPELHGAIDGVSACRPGRCGACAAAVGADIASRRRSSNGRAADSRLDALLQHRGGDRPAAEGLLGRKRQGYWRPGRVTSMRTSPITTRFTPGTRQALSQIHGIAVMSDTTAQPDDASLRRSARSRWNRWSACRRRSTTTARLSCSGFGWLGLGDRREQDDARTGAVVRRCCSGFLGPAPGQIGWRPWVRGQE